MPFVNGQLCHDSFKFREKIYLLVGDFVDICKCMQIMLVKRSYEKSSLETEHGAHASGS